MRWTLNRVTDSGRYVFVTWDFYRDAPFFYKISKEDFWGKTF